MHVCTLPRTVCLAKGIKLKPSLVLNYGEGSPEARREPHMGLGGHSGQRHLAARGCGT